MEKMQKLQEMLVADPDDLFLMHALALENIKAGNETVAEHLFLRILTGHPAYVGSYYHLGRLLERTGRSAEAAVWYEKGMTAAGNAGDQHAYNELQTAFEDISDP